MILKADERGRVASTEIFRPGAAYEFTPQADGSLRVMELVQKPPRKTFLVRKDGRTYLDSNIPVTNEEVQKAMEEFP